MSGLDIGHTGPGVLLLALCWLVRGPMLSSNLYDICPKIVWSLLCIVPFVLSAIINTKVSKAHITQHAICVLIWVMFLVCSVGESHGLLRKHGSAIMGSWGSIATAAIILTHQVPSYILTRGHQLIACIFLVWAVLFATLTKAPFSSTPWYILRFSFGAMGLVFMNMGVWRSPLLTWSDKNDAHHDLMNFYSLVCACVTGLLLPFICTHRRIKEQTHHALEGPMEGDCEDDLPVQSRATEFSRRSMEQLP